MFWQRKIHEGEQMPRGWGVAYLWCYPDPLHPYHICYPVPLNLLVRWARSLYWSAAKRRRGDLVWQIYSRVYRHEHKKAYDGGYEGGYTAGYEAGQHYRSLLTDLVRELKRKED